jgi:hypothetical protein
MSNAFDHLDTDAAESYDAQHGVGTAPRNVSDSTLQFLWSQMMACTHLRQLYQLCQDQHLRLGGSDLIRVVCQQCGEQDICPSSLVDDSDGPPGNAIAEEQSSGQGRARES